MNQKSAFPSHSLRVRGDTINDKAMGTSDSVVRTIVCGRSKVVLWPSAALPRSYLGNYVQLWAPHINASQTRLYEYNNRSCLAWERVNSGEVEL